MTQTNEITNLEMENMDKKRELIKSMVQVAIKMQKELSFTNPNTATDEDAFALIEDSNFHSFNEKFENLWNKEHDRHIKMGGK